MVQPQVNIQPEQKRARNFREVSLGYPKKLAIEESVRCPQCSDPVCMFACPIGVNIPSFIRSLREGEVSQAYAKIREENCLPSVCGRICSAPCEAACVLNDEDAPIGIRALERFASDHGRDKQIKVHRNGHDAKRVAIIGSGPSGLAAAWKLAKNGCTVKIFEALDKPGGILRYGIPGFRMPKKILDAEINDIRALGVEIETNFYLGKTQTIDELKAQGFDAILLATGAGIPKFIDIPGVNLGGVYYGEEFLMRINRIQSNFVSSKKAGFIVGDRIVVLGSGNTALDCARAAKRFGKDVTLIFRRTEDEMLVRPIERDYAKEEGVHIESLVRPVEILSDEEDFVTGVKCIRLDYAENAETQEWELVPAPDSEFVLDADMFIIAVGHKPNSIIKDMGANITVDEDQSISIDEETYLTSLNGIFACGNVVTNAGPVVEAIASGKQAAERIATYFESFVEQEAS